ncbi:lipid A 4'-phosphatase [soil metagenome]
MESLNHLDQQLLLLINGIHDPVVDFIMYWISEKIVWVPFYLWILYTLYKIYGKELLWFLPVIALMITASDQISVLIKDQVLRFRPCHEPAIQSMVHLVNNRCGGSYGFISSHAANSMALCAFLMIMLPTGFELLKRELIAFVILIGYSRVYLGNHYPGDVIGGWILGLVLGIIFAKILSKKITVPELITPDHE